MEQYIPVLSGLAGALLGALASTLGVFVNGRLETRRQLSKLAYEAALKDWEGAVGLVAKGGPRTVMPLTSYIYFHAHYMQLISTGKLTKKGLEKLNADMDALWPQKLREGVPGPQPAE